MFKDKYNKSQVTKAYNDSFFVHACDVEKPEVQNGKIRYHVTLYRGPGSQLNEIKSTSMIIAFLFQRPSFDFPVRLC